MCLVWVVGDAGGGDCFEKLGAGEPRGESVEELIDKAAEGDALLVEVEHHKHPFTSLVHFLQHLTRVSEHCISTSELRKQLSG